MIKKLSNWSKQHYSIKSTDRSQDSTNFTSHKKESPAVNPIIDYTSDFYKNNTSSNSQKLLEKVKRKKQKRLER